MNWCFRFDRVLLALSRIVSHFDDQDISGELLQSIYSHLSKAFERAQDKIRSLCPLTFLINVTPKQGLTNTHCWHAADYHNC